MVAGNEASIVLHLILPVNLWFTPTGQLTVESNDQLVDALFNKISL